MVWLDRKFQRHLLVYHDAQFAQWELDQKLKTETFGSRRPYGKVPSEVVGESG